MSTSFLAGILAAFAVSHVGVGAVFVRAWSRRREEGEYLLFGLYSFSLAVFTAGLVWFYASFTTPDWRSTWIASASFATAGAIMALPLVVHFVFRFARVPNERRWIAPVYVAALLYLIVLLSGNWWTRIPDAPVAVPFAGGMVLTTPSFPTAIATSFFVVAALAMLVVVATLARAYVTGKRDALPAFIGSLVLGSSVLNDAAHGAGKHVGVFFSSFGYVVFAFGVSLTLVSRYGRLATELELRSEDLRKRTKELRRSYKELMKAQSELVRKEQLAVVGELAAVIAHEVRNPLAIIANAVAGLRRSDIASDDRATLLQIIDEETSRLNRLVTDLLSYARPISPQRQLLSLRELVQRSLALVEASPGVKVQIDFEPGVPPVWGDANLLRQVFDNLVGNAAQAMHGEGTLTVNARAHVLEDVSGVLLDFKDTGEGMDTQVRSRAKTPFFTTRPSGTGLGLAIVDRIVEAHGGTMTLASKPGEGTTVGVFLPIGSDAPSPRPKTDSHRPSRDRVSRGSIP